MSQEKRLRVLGALFIASALSLITTVHAAEPHVGRNLAATCAGCHGTNGRAVEGEIKALAGMEKTKMLESLNAFASGDKPATIMHQITKGYTKEQLALIADFYANQK